MTFEGLVSELVVAGLGVVIASQGWVLKEIHRVNVLLAGKHSEFEQRHLIHDRDLLEVNRRLRELETRMTHREERDRD